MSKDPPPASPIVKPSTLEAPRKEKEIAKKLSPEEEEKRQRELEAAKEEERVRREQEEKERQEREAKEAIERAEREHLRRIVLCQAVVRKWGVRRWYLQERAYVVHRVTVCQKLQRGRLARRLALRLFLARKGLRHSLGELLQTEVRYCDSLVTLVEVYFRSFVSASKGDNPKVSWNTVEVVFGNVAQLANMHQTLLPEFTSLLQPPINVGVLRRLKNLMSELAKQISAYYPEYINNFMRSQAELSRCMLQPDFAAFMEGIQAKHADRLGTQTLSSFLIMPIQRPPRYRLLLEDLVKHIDPYYRREALGIRQVANEISQAASTINEIQRVFEERQTFLAKAPLIKESKKDIKDLDDGRRGLLAEGKAVEFFDGSNSKDSSEEVHLFLLTDLLLITTPYLNTSANFNRGHVKEGMKSLGESRFDVTTKLAVAAPFCPFSVYDLPEVPSARFAVRIEAFDGDWAGEGESQQASPHDFNFESETAKNSWLEQLEKLKNRTWKEEEEEENDNGVAMHV